MQKGKQTITNKQFFIVINKRISIDFKSETIFQLGL